MLVTLIVASSLALQINPLAGETVNATGETSTKAAVRAPAHVPLLCST